MHLESSIIGYMINKINFMQKFSWNDLLSSLTLSSLIPIEVFLVFASFQSVSKKVN